QIIWQRGVRRAVRIVPLDELVGSIAGQTGIRDGEHLVPGVADAAGKLVEVFENVVVVAVAAKIRGHEGIVRTLRWVVQAPVQSVNVKLNIVAVRGSMTHIEL